jgi:hypothetical protein
MNKSENFPQGEEMPLMEIGSRPSIHQEGKSHFDETYDAMLDALRAKGDESLGNFIAAFPPDVKNKLGAALNENGRDWKFLATISKENSTAAMAKIAEWENSIKAAADAGAIRNANCSLADSLEDL